MAIASRTRSSFASRGTTTWSLVALVALFVLAVPAAAFAAPTFSLPLPAPGAVLSTRTVQLSVLVTSDSLVRRDNARLVVDGVQRPVWGEWPSTGYWADDEDGCGAYWVDIYDYNQCGFFAPPPGLTLATGSHAATLTVTDADGDSASYRWTFTLRDGAPLIDSLAPAPGSVVATSQPLISAALTYGGLLQSVSLAVDGHPMPASYDGVTGVVSYRPPTPMSAEATHHVAVTAVDPYGATVTREWDFRIQVVAAMPLSTDCMGCHAPRRYDHPIANCGSCHGAGERPVRNCPACHAGGHAEPYDFLQLQGQGTYTCTSCHGARYPLVPQHGGASEEAVHETSTDMTACLQCHVGSLTREHGQRTDGTGTPYDCATCHSSANPVVRDAITAGDTACGTCHGSTGHESAHVTTLDIRCTGCHKASLTAEHLANPLTQATTLGCDSCHSSTRPDILWALVSGDVSCSACHDSAHSLGLVERPLLPMYAGFTWSAPLDAATFAGESWMPGDMGTARVVVSDRRTGVAGDDVWTFYRDRMSAEGWVLDGAAPSPGAARFSARWTRSGHAVVVWFYTGQTHASSPDGRGARIELIYR